MKIVGADIQSPDVFSPINKGIICVGCCYFITCAGMFCAHSSLFPLLFLTPNYCIPGFKQSTAMEKVSQGNHPPTYLYSFLPINESAGSTSCHSHCKQSLFFLQRWRQPAGEVGGPRDAPRKPRSSIRV